MLRPSRTIQWMAGCWLALTIAALTVNSARLSTACPFCSAINLTFAEQLESNDIVVIAKLLDVPAPVTDPDADLPKATFEIESVLKGDRVVAEAMKFKALLVGRHEIGQKFLVMGVDPPSVAWSTPMKASDRVVEYISAIGKLPTRGPKRLMFFQNYFEDEESVLAFDAYDEFARAPYEDLIAIKDQMKHDQLVAWIKSPETSINRRRLYFTMLGVCGTKKDAQMLEGFIKSGDRKQQAGLDALIACFLNLRGEKAVGLIEDTFIRDKNVEYVDTLAAVSALRFHGTEMERVPRERIVAAVRLLLDRPKMADMIIPDLARWEDWSVMERLVQMFKDADDESNWIRVPVITYLRACPKPEAKKYIDELAKIDPDAVKRADYFLDFEDFGSSDEEDDDGESAGDSKSDGDSKIDKGSKVDKGSEAGGGESDGELAGATYTSIDSGDCDVELVQRVEKVVTLKVPVGADAGANPAESEKRAPAGLVSSENSPIDANSNRAVAGDVPEMTNTSNRSDRATDPESVAQVIPAPVPALSPASSGGSLAMIVLVPMAASAVIFVLLWSVISGWFERLIF